MYTLCMALAVSAAFSASRSIQVREASPDTVVRRLLYAASPGIRDYLQYGGHGVVVFDIGNGHKFVKRIPMGGLSATGTPENVKGIAANAGTRKLYVSTLNHLMCIDLITDSLLWDRKYPLGCDRMALSPDGKTLYQPSLENDAWYVLDAVSGDELKRISIAGIKSHNTVFGPDGKRVYMAGLGSAFLQIAETANQAVSMQVGPFAAPIRPFTIDGRQTRIYANVNSLLGFEIGDLRTGKKLYRVQVPGFDTGFVERHGCPSHGIALTKDETEVWVVDGHNHYVHVFDNTISPPRLKTSLKLRDFVGWITMSIDGTLAYPSTGDVIDVKTKKIVSELKDEAGRAFQSEKMLEIDFRGDEPVAAGNQFGIGGVGDVVTLVPGVKREKLEPMYPNRPGHKGGSTGAAQWTARGEKRFQTQGAPGDPTPQRLFTQP